MQCWFLRFYCKVGKTKLRCVACSVWLMCYGEWAVIRNLGGSRSCCVLGRDCTEVRRYKKLSTRTHEQQLWITSDEEEPHECRKVGSDQV